MLKYIYIKELFTEIPSEISLGISISGCPIHCPECNQKELWEDTGTPLTAECLEVLLQEHKGITCLLLLGGEADIDALTNLFYHARRQVKTAWYSGLDKLPKDKEGILQYLDFIKLGHYDSKLGGLDSPKTNQHLYKICKSEGSMYDYALEDITHLLQKHH